MAKEFLHRTDVVPFSQQMRRKGVPQTVAVRTFHNSGRLYCLFDGALQNSFCNVMSLSFTATRIDSNARGRENILPRQAFTLLRSNDSIPATFSLV
jgi:hypothetical protein